MWVLRGFVYLVVAFMLLPVLISLPIALTSAETIRFPPPGISFRWFASLLNDQILLETICRSLALATISSAIAVAIGLPCAFAIERSRMRLRTFFETFITAPRMIPQIVFVLAVLIYFEQVGLAETFTGLVIAHIVIAMPFAFRTLIVSVSSLDRRLEWSSAILGADSRTTFFEIILPQIKTGVISAFIFSFVLSFNNVTLALFLSALGQRTLPVEMFYRMFVGGLNPSVTAIAFVLALVGAGFFIILDRTLGVYKFLAAKS